MRGRRLTFVFVSALVAPGYLACQLVDPESDLEAAGSGSGDSGVLHPDVSVGDGAAPSPDATSDATLTDGGAGTDADTGAGSQPGDAAADATPFCAGQDARICDDFTQDDGPVDAMASPYLLGTSCDTGSIQVTGGRLTIDHPVNDGTRFSSCTLQGDPPGNTAQFSLQFDFSYQLPGGYTDAQVPELAIISSVAVNLGAPNDAGIQDIDFQLLLASTGAAQYLAIPYYPDGSKTPPPQKGNNYPTYHIAETVDSAPWIPPATNCRIVVTGNTVNVTGTAQATCNGVAIPLPTDIDPPPPGIAAPVTLSLGYTQAEGQGIWPEWTVSYDNLLFRAGP